MSELFNHAERQQQLDERKRALDRHYRAILATGNIRAAEIVRNAADELFLKDNPYFFDAMMRMNKVPVPIDEFLDSKEFLGDQVDIWPTLRQDIIDINPDVILGAPPITQVLMGGGTGTGKTEVSRITFAYQTYLLTCFDQPQRLYGLPPSTVIVGLFISTQSGVTRRVLYSPFRLMFLGMPYVKRWVPYDRHRDSSLLLNDNIEIVPSLPSVTAMVGQAINMALLDEVNFMQIVEQSKQTAGARGQGGYFDQAELTFRTLTRRRVSRFSKAGRVSIGSICAISSTRYKNDFLDRRIAEVKAAHEIGIEMDVKWFRRKQYETQPGFDPRAPSFRLLVGNDQYQTRVLRENEVEGTHYPDGAWVENIPMKYLADFRGDPDGSLRDIVGEASSVIAPFITQRHKVIQAIQRGTVRGMLPWVFKQNVDLIEDGMPQVDEENLPPARERRMDWFVHIDLSKNKDRCGIAFVRTDGVVDTINVKTHAVETVPKYVIGCGISIQPHVTRELDISEIRQWVMLFKTHYGFTLKLVSYDGFASTESVILLRKAGINSALTSMDTSTEAYDTLKDALYNDRVDMVNNDLLKTELVNLEKNEKKNKIDHPPKGCHVGETMVRLSDGKIMRLDAMVGQSGLQVLTWDGTRAAPAPAINPRLTKYVDELIEIEMDDGSVERCTPDHPWLLEAGYYLAAEDLLPGTELRAIP